MFKYLLKNVTFDNSYKNVPYFKNVIDRNDNLIGNDTFTSTLHNFNFGNILYTSCVVNTYNFENYFILQENNTVNYRFYFITNAEYLSTNQWKLSLELDVMTMYINGVNTSTFGNCMINNAHCDRFVYDNTLQKLKFNVVDNSPIIQHEINYDKITTKRHIVELEYCDNTTVNNWLKENVACWEYLVVDHSHKYSARAVDTQTPQAIPYNEEVIRYNFATLIDVVQCDYSVMCVPRYKGENCIQMLYSSNNNNTIIQIDREGLDGFLELNNNYEYVYSSKMSLMPPIDFEYIDENDYILIDGNLTIVNCDYEMQGGAIGHIENKDAVATGFTNPDLDRVRHGLFTNVIQSYNLGIFSEPIVTNFKYNFNVSDLKGNRSVDFEPKVLNDCYSITLRDSGNGEFTYNALYVNKPELLTLYSEGITVNSNNYYYRLLPHGIIPNVTLDNWDGVVNTVDNTMIIANNNLGSYLANNKNFLLLKSIGIIPELLIGNILPLVGEVVNTTLNVNNIINRKNSLKNVNNDLLLSLMVNEGINLYVDIEQVRDVDINCYYMKLYCTGYTLNIYDNPLHYINTRKYFNYLKCEMEHININVPDIIENKIKEIFRNGVRMWNIYSEMYNYQKENYEKFIDGIGVS